MTDNAKRGYDVIIVGAGPAGLCAAMYAGRGMLKALTIERGAPGGELLNTRSEEHTSELQSRLHLVCRLLLEKKKNKESRDVRQTARNIDTECAVAISGINFCVDGVLRNEVITVLLHSGGS